MAVLRGVARNRVDTSTAPDIEWPAVPVME
ncbi:tail fiber assembly protein [Escherichia coli]